MRTATRLLTAESIVLLHDDRPLDAVRNQSLGFIIGRHAANGDLLLGDLTARGIDAVTISGFQKILYHSGSDPRVTDAVRKAIETSWRPHDLVRALRNEAGSQVVALWVLRFQHSEFLDQELGTGSTGKLNLKPWEISDFVDDNGRTLLKREREVIAGAALPYAQADLAFRRADTLMQNDPDHRHILALTAFPMYSGLPARRAELQATADVTRAAAALLAWRARHGRLPSRLESAIEPVPIDPFDGKPLNYRREGDGFVVYCVGADGRFKGGVPGKRRYQHDVLFRYPLPSYLKHPAAK
jgi:hypothetical protein